MGGGTRFRWEKEVTRKVWKWEGVLGTLTSPSPHLPGVMEWKGRRPCWLCVAGLLNRAQLLNGSEPSLWPTRGPWSLQVVTHGPRPADPGARGPCV